MDIPYIDFDLRTAILTLLIVPIGAYLLIGLRRLLLRAARYVIDAAIVALGRTVMGSLSGMISARAYAIHILEGPSKILKVPGAREIELETDSIFVPLLLESGLEGGRRFTPATVLASGNRIQIVGDPGSGKSSLVKRILRDCAYDLRRRPTRSRLPVAVDASEFIPPTDIVDDSIESWVIAELRRQCSNSPAFKGEDLFEAYAAGRGAVVLIDGLDEVPSAELSRTLDAIRELSRILDRMGEKNTLIVTMRSSFHALILPDLRDLFTTSLYVKGFTPSDIFEFLTRWPFPDHKLPNVTRIYADLTDRPTLREMCTNPLVLAMYVGSDQESSRTAHALPESRTEFYDKVVEELLILRRWRQGVKTVARTALREQREAILGRICFAHLLDTSQPANSVSWSSALATTSAVTGCSKEEAEAYFDDLMKETGICSVERAGQTIRFIHLTFCEFFAAIEAARGQIQGMDTLLSAYQESLEAHDAEQRSRFTEVVPFAVGLTSRANRPGALEEVYDLSEWSVIGRCLIETQLYSGDRWHDILESELRSIGTTAHTNWDPVWVGRLQLATAVISDASRVSHVNPGATPRTSLETLYQSLIASDKSRMNLLFTSLAAQDPVTAFRLADSIGVELVRDAPSLLIESLQQEALLTLVIDEWSRSSPERRIELAPVLAEAGLRYRSVAHRLMESDADDPAMVLIRDLPKQRLWKFGNGANLLSVSLTLAINASQETEFAALSIVRGLPGPRSSLLSSRWLQLIGIVPLFLAYIPILWSINATSDGDFSTLSVIVPIAIAAAVTVLISPISSLPRRWWVIYRSIAGVEEVVAVESPSLLDALTFSFSIRETSAGRLEGGSSDSRAVETAGRGIAGRLLLRQRRVLARLEVLRESRDFGPAPTQAD